MSNPWRRRMIENKRKMNYAKLFWVIILGYLLMKLLILIFKLID